MKKKELNRILNDGFKESLKNLGFKKSKLSFYKPIDNLWSIEFNYSIIDYGNIFPSTFSFSLSYSLFDIIYSKIFQITKKELWIYSTSITSLYERGKYLFPEYEIMKQADAIKMINEVTEYMKNEAIPFLESIANFESLDDYYNQNPTRPDFGIRGLIIAKMAENPNYEALKQKYRQLFIDKNWAVKEDIENLETVINFLDKHTKEELDAIAKI
ncbi:hypothetical protein [Cellulophaga baltica]|uniref:hypothetical protein n=1 Tax=Cellulophaga baltica TaxID=76594 RepID=UPI0015F3DDF3|nr:hypothetical protein [Cellulophaga baltica]MBA6315424.1 hypothetical protein [Cellulophaga baltica]